MTAIAKAIALLQITLIFKDDTKKRRLDFGAATRNDYAKRDLYTDAFIGNDIYRNSIEFLCSKSGQS